MTNPPSAAPGVAVGNQTIEAMDAALRILEANGLGFAEDVQQKLRSAISTALLAGATGGQPGGILGLVETHPNYVAGYKAGHAAGRARSAPPVPVRAPQGVTPEMLAAFKDAFKEGSIWEDRVTAGAKAMFAASRLGTGALPADLCASLMAASNNILTGTAGLSDSKACATAADLLAATPPSAAPTSTPEPQGPGYIRWLDKGLESLSHTSGSAAPAEPKSDMTTRPGSDLYFDELFYEKLRKFKTSPPGEVQVDAARKLAWLLDGKRGKRIWNHVLEDHEKQGHNFIHEVLTAAIASHQAGVSGGA